jgi:hypothetical protein
MAAELKVIFRNNNTATVYAVIRRISDGYVFNGSTFEAWATANIATYDIPLSWLLEDVFAEDWPALATEDQYFVVYYQQTSTGPAVTDPIIGSESVQWDGDNKTPTEASNLFNIAHNKAAASVYFMVRQYHSGSGNYYAWNGTSFASYTYTDDPADYDVALTDKSGDMYQGTFPEDIDAGNYTIIVYAQAGSAPAYTDPILSTIERYWDGYVLQDVAPINIGRYALTTLEGVKRHLRITDTDSDLILADLINQVSAMIEHTCGRKFKARNYRRRYSGGFQQHLLLDQTPVQYVNRISYGWENALVLTFTNTGSAYLRANANVYRSDDGDTTGGLRLITIRRSDGYRDETTMTFTDYPTAQLMATYINSLAGPWTATVQNDCPSADLDYVASGEAIGYAIQLTYPAVNLADFSVDYERGLVQFRHNQGYHYQKSGSVEHDNPRRFPTGGMSDILVEYRAGYETIPGDVELLCRELVAVKYYSSQQNPMVRSQTLGPFSVSFGGDDTDRVRTMLSDHIDARAMIA